MVFPLGLILVAVATAFAVAYGADARWMQYPHGLDIIVYTRKFQWPLVSLSLLACIGLMALIVSARKRAWWLIGLAPVLALFAHRFAIGPAAGTWTVAENPEFVSADQTAAGGDDDYIVGLTFGDTPYAYPYAVLFSEPVVIQSDHEKRMMLLWSAYANRALAVNIRHDLKARDLEVVSTPANALLVYDSRLGQFINGLKGQTTRGERPPGFSAPIITQKMPWKQWRSLHPDTKVMLPPANLRQPGAAPTRPLLPTCPMPPARLDRPANLRIAMIGTTQPAAVEADRIGPAPVNLRADNQPVFLVREIAGQPIHAFSRQVKAELLPRFVMNTNPRRHPTAAYVDVDTNSGWDANGGWVDGLKDLKGTRLARVPVEDDLYWGVMKFWYADLQIEPISTQPPELLPDEVEPQTRPARRGRSRRAADPPSPPARRSGR